MDSNCKTNKETQRHGGGEATGRVETMTVYHGTSQFFLPDIKAVGSIKPFRMSGLVYLSSSLERAQAYATSWAIGLHAIGVSPSRKGVVVACTTPVSSPVREVQMCEFAIEPDLLTLEKYIDVPIRTPKESDPGWVFQFLGIVADFKDKYTVDEPYATWMENAKQYIKRVPKDEFDRAISLTPCF